MISNVRSAEEWLAEVDRIIHAYRTSERKGPPSVTRQGAVKQLMELGLTVGDAWRYLDGKKTDPPAGAQHWK